MTNANEPSQPENVLDMRSIMIALPGVSPVRTEEDIERIARETGEPKGAVKTSSARRPSSSGSLSRPRLSDPSW